MPDLRYELLCRVPCIKISSPTKREYVHDTILSRLTLKSPPPPANLLYGSIDTTVLRVVRTVLS